jgi:hypothetical protein
MKGLIGKILFGMLLIAMPVALVSVPSAFAADAPDTDTTRTYCGINAECAS